MTVQFFNKWFGLEKLSSSSLVQLEIPTSKYSKHIILVVSFLGKLKWFGSVWMTFNYSSVWFFDRTVP